MRTFIVWRVYGTVGGRVGVLIREFPYREEQPARSLASETPGGWVQREKVER